MSIKIKYQQLSYKYFKRFLPKCDACRRNVFILKKRYYTIPNIQGRITSQNKLCNKCAKNIKLALSQNHG